MMLGATCEKSRRVDDGGEQQGFGLHPRELAIACDFSICNLFQESQTYLGHSSS